MRRPSVRTMRSRTLTRHGEMFTRRDFPVLGGNIRTREETQNRCHPSPGWRQGGSMDTTFARSAIGLIAIVTALASSVVRAQEGTASPEDDTDASGLETIVVTGTAIASGVRKLEASYN